MENVRVQLSPYDIFSSTVGGLPLPAAILVLAEPTGTPREVTDMFIRDASIATLLLVLAASYVAGNVASVFSWPMFLRAAALLHYDYRYVRDENLQDSGTGPEADHLTDAIIPAVRETFGYTATPSRLDSRIIAYLATRDRHETLRIADNFQVMHIMARSLFFGMIVLAGTILVRLLWTGFGVDSLLAAGVCCASAYGLLIRSVHFKIWHSRSLALGFYFYASRAHDGR